MDDSAGHEDAITIRHTHEDGTLVYGTCKGDGVYELIGPRTAARFRWFPSMKMIGIPQSRDHLAKRGHIAEAAKALRAAGFEVIVEIDDVPRDVAEAKADRAGRLDDRHDRLTTRAERSAGEATARFNRADQISQRFAGGQPILVGHHSERGARADQKRIDQNMHAGCVAADKADYAAAAASAVGKADAYRELPPVIIRRIDRLEAELRQTDHYINGTRPANGWRGAYSLDRQPASGARLEELTARKTFLEHQIAGDRATLAGHEANGYTRLSRETVHKGDTVSWSSRFGDSATVTRANPKTVTLNRDSWPRTLPYEQILSVDCPHQDTTTTVTAPRRPAARPTAPVTPVERPAARPEPLQVDARTECFTSPPAVVARIIEAAGIRPGMTVLEPSAGTGSIAIPVAELGTRLDCIELNGQLAQRLRQAGIARDVWCTDFLDLPAEPVYDRVLMNPPFNGQADIRHVTRALGWVKPGGMVVAVMSAGVEFRQDKTAETFRELVASCGGRIERLPDGAFEASGTSIRTVLAVIPVSAATATCQEPAPVPVPASVPAPPPAATPRPNQKRPPGKRNAEPALFDIADVRQLLADVTGDPARKES